MEPYNAVARQSIVAEVARNYYQHGFHFFYPELDENGKGPYLYNAELPVHSYLMALGYKLVGGVKAWAARLVSVFFSMGALLFLFLFARRLYNEKFALIVLAFAALSPMSLALSRSLQPEAEMIFASVGALYTFYRFQETRQLKYYLFSAALMFLAVAAKLYNGYLFIPLFFIAWQFQGSKVFKDPKNFLTIFIACLPLIWYAVMWHLGQTQHLAYTPYNPRRGPADKSHLELLFSLHYLKITSKTFLVHILTPLGALLFFPGLWGRIRNKADQIIYVWFFSTVFLMLVVWRAVIDHPYYQFPLVPVAAFFVAKGAEKLAGLSAAKKLFKMPWLLVFVAVLEIASLAYFYKGLYFIPKRLDSILEAGQAVERLTPPESLVVASFETSAIQLYYCNRKGWTLSVATESEAVLIVTLEKYRKEGAGYFVLSNLKEFERVPVFEKYLRGRYPVVAETKNYVLFELNAARPDPLHTKP